MDKRYQVFVSSTYTDLKEERKSIIENLLNAKYIPSGMEMFSASNDEQFKYIKKILDTCDYFILIVGARYGTINPTTGISFTEQEYDYAVSKNIPVLVFLHSDPYNLPSEKREDEKRVQLDAFRTKASTSRMGSMWNNTIGLTASVIISLTEQVSDNPQLGWTRGNSYDSTDLLAQINKLRLEKEEQEVKISKLQKVIKESSAKVDNLACGDDKYKIIGEKITGYGSQACQITLTWDDIFASIGPYLISYKNYTVLKGDLKESINSAYSKSFCSLNEDCVQTIKIQLHALGLIEVKSLKSVSNGMAEFIGLTEKGKSYLLQSKSIKKVPIDSNIS